MRNGKTLKWRLSNQVEHRLQNDVRQCLRPAFLHLKFVLSLALFSSTTLMSSSATAQQQPAKRIGPLHTERYINCTPAPEGDTHEDRALSPQERLRESSCRNLYANHTIITTGLLNAVANERHDMTSLEFRNLNAGTQNNDSTLKQRIDASNLRFMEALLTNSAHGTFSALVLETSILPSAETEFAFHFCRFSKAELLDLVQTRTRFQDHADRLVFGKLGIEYAQNMQSTLGTGIVTLFYNAKTCGQIKPHPFHGGRIRAADLLARLFAGHDPSPRRLFRDRIQSIEIQKSGFAFSTHLNKELAPARGFKFLTHLVSDLILGVPYRPMMVSDISQDNFNQLFDRIQDLSRSFDPSREKIDRQLKALSPKINQLKEAIEPKFFPRSDLVRLARLDDKEQKNSEFIEAFHKAEAARHQAADLAAAESKEKIDQHQRDLDPRYSSRKAATDAPLKNQQFAKEMESRRQTKAKSEKDSPTENRIDPQANKNQPEPMTLKSN